MNSVLGVDCGNVILSQMNGTPVRGALDALRTLNGSGKFESIWVVSKCGPRVQELSRQWLRDLDFWNFTGIPESNIRFCLRRPDKAPICEDLGVTHFIDDRPDVLCCLRTVDNIIAFNPSPSAMARYYEEFDKDIFVVANWKEALELLLR